MTTAQQLIEGALKRINVYAAGESLASDDANDALGTLNELLDSRSTDRDSVFCTTENIFTFTPGQYQYTIGNYDAGDFAGTVTSGSATITAVTPPADLIAGSDLTGTGIPTGTTVVSKTLTTITMSAQATLSPGAQQIRYTVPGNLKMTRPLRVSRSFTRITTQTQGLDYPIDVLAQDTYTQIGFKGVSAPWPVGMWYNPTMPLGNLYFYQTPSSAGELHLFTDVILSSFSQLTTDVRIPQGYVRWLKWDLAKELAPEYGVDWTPNMQINWKEAYDAVKALNAQPVPCAMFDSDLMFAGMRGDASFYLHGGFNR